MSNPKVSIIIPVYNAGEYLKACLDSLVNQSLKEIEIILVLDCPKDGSDEVAKKYAENDKRIKIIENSENLHIGCSRNAGLKLAKGTYIGFADHDDFCDRKMFQLLVETALSEDADIVISDYCDENNGVRMDLCFPIGLDKADFNQKMFEALINGRYSKPNARSFDNVNVIWNQIFKREFLTKHHIEFTDNRKITMEDVLFNIKTHYFSKNTVYVPEILYHHITNGRNEFQNYNYRAVDKITAHINEVYSFLVDNDILAKYKKEYTICSLRRLYTSFRNEVKFKGLASSIKFFNIIRKNEIMQNILSNFKDNRAWLDDFTITKRIFYKIISK